MYNAMTIDVEDYFMVSAFSDVVRFEDWPGYESRVERNTRKILELLAEHGIKGTFFILGWVAERNKGLVREIHGAGHEVACHGYNHRLVYNLSPGEFREDVRKVKTILEDITGAAVLGYRAASYSIVLKSLWALDILIEEGFRYDSSIFPIYHDRYGVPGADRFAHEIKRNGGMLMEFPPSTFRVFGINMPVAGGGYFRLTPISITKSLIRTINAREKKPVVFYVHPWEIDAGQPRIKGKWLSEFRHNLNLESTFPKMKALIKEFKFRPLKEFCASNE